MSLRDLIDFAYTLLVDELRRAGVALHDAIASVDDMFAPEDPVREQEAKEQQEREAARRTEAAIGQFLQIAGGKPTTVGKPRTA